MKECQKHDCNYNIKGICSSARTVYLPNTKHCTGYETQNRKTHKAPNYSYVYAVKADYLHDRSCDKIGTGHPKDGYEYYNKFKRGTRLCNFCKIRAYIRNGAWDVGVNMTNYLKLYAQNKVSQDALFSLYILKNAKTELTSNALLVNVKGEKWRIQFERDGFLLQHNNYRKEGDNKIRNDYYHNQVEDFIPLSACINIIINYHYEDNEVMAELNALEENEKNEYFQDKPVKKEKAVHRNTECKPEPILQNLKIRKQGPDSTKDTSPKLSSYIF